VPAVFTGVFMDHVAGFLKLYFPVFLLGAVFGKLIELSGFSQSIASTVIRLVGQPHNGAVITLLAVTGLTHRQSYRDIFAITCGVPPKEFGIILTRKRQHFLTRHQERA
jgi:H+/gluconate symporter-like permease